MSRLDIVIFGATGFTGRKVVEEAVRISKKTPMSWGIAGRSPSKLEELLVQVGNLTGDDLSKTKIIIADVKDEQSLRDMTSQAKVVANCCGPYRHLGEPVVKASIATNTHHVDVTGEPQFIETMQLKYDSAAHEAGVYIVSACGFDSIPNDMGVVFLQQNFGGTVNSVESYLGTKISSQYQMEAFKSGSVHYGTWESLVYSLANWKELLDLRKQLYPNKMPTFQPKLQPRSTLHRVNSKWALPFPGADNSIVYRTQRYLYDNQQQRPVQFKAYLKTPNLLSTLILVFNCLIIYAMAMWTFSRNLLLKFPRVFSSGVVTHDGPKEEIMNNTFFTFELRGEGWGEGADVDKEPPNKKVVAKVRGSNPYAMTATGLLYSALTVLHEQEKMPASGGVLTTGAAFGKTDLIKHLNENKLTFEIVEY